jgi:hypothetical protein
VLARNTSCAGWIDQIYRYDTAKRSGSTRRIGQERFKILNLESLARPWLQADLFSRSLALFCALLIQSLHFFQFCEPGHSSAGFAQLDKLPELGPVNRTAPVIILHSAALAGNSARPHQQKPKPS